MNSFSATPKAPCRLLILLLLIINARGLEDGAESAETLAPAESDNPADIVSPTNGTFNEFCKLPLDPGNGTEEMQRFYYDFAKKACFNFTFTGEGGNQNNFASDVDCLNECYIDVGEGDPLNETDIVIIEPRSVDTAQLVERCFAPNKSLECTEPKQRFYYSADLQVCFAFKSCGSDVAAYETREECESSCKPMDGSVCGPQQEPLVAVKLGEDCSTTECPAGSICLQGMIPQCCNRGSRELIDTLYADKCPGGREAAGRSGDFFLPSVARTCEDLVCEAGYECEQIRESVAKCCLTKKKPASAKPPLAKDTPLLDALHQGWLRRVAMK